jgi:hypothetical protein
MECQASIAAGSPAEMRRSEEAQASRKPVLVKTQGWLLGPAGLFGTGRERQQGQLQPERFMQCAGLRRFSGKIRQLMGVPTARLGEPQQTPCRRLYILQLAWQL